MTQHSTVNTTRPPDSTNVGDYYDHGFFAVMAELWDGNLHYGLWRDNADQSTFEEAMVQMTDDMIRRLDPAPGDRILDVGCGNGTPALRLARERPVEVVGISVSEQQVARATERARAAGLADRVRFMQVNAMDLPFAAESFDGAWALESMLHMPDKVRVLSEMARVVRPGGRVPIADLVYREPPDPDYTGQMQATGTAIYASLVRLETYPRLLEEAGLHPLNVRDVTRETYRSYQGFSEGLRSRRARFVELFGTQGFDLLISNQESLGRMPELGYVLITARRPPT
jgi:27-O-demethylrifamycin SV methyltransferase